MQERGPYQTKQQKAVLAFFEAQQDLCFTAEEAYLHLQGLHLEVGKTTVYRAVARLCETGVLRRYVPAGSGDAACYQFNPCRDNHLHIRCSACGELAHMDCQEVTEFCRHIAIHHGFVLNEGQTVLVGFCQACADKQTDQSTEDNPCERSY